jgi:cytochrome bd-type quinol oxidase subunit 1
MDDIKSVVLVDHYRFSMLSIHSLVWILLVSYILRIPICVKFATFTLVIVFFAHCINGNLEWNRCVSLSPTKCCAASNDLYEVKPRQWHEVPRKYIYYGIYLVFNILLSTTIIGNFSLQSVNNLGLSTYRCVADTIKSDNNEEDDPPAWLYVIDIISKILFSIAFFVLAVMLLYYGLRFVRKLRSAPPVSCSSMN